MGFIEDIFKALDRIPIWDRLQKVPAEVDALAKRISILEGQLEGKWPADVCKYCGERTVRLHSTMGPIEGGKMRQSWRCSACNKTEIRMV